MRSDSSEVSGLVSILSNCDGTVAIRSMEDTVLIDPKIKNGSWNPPILYNHAPRAGPTKDFGNNYYSYSV